MERKKAVRHKRRKNMKKSTFALIACCMMCVAMQGLFANGQAEKQAVAASPSVTQSAPDRYPVVYWTTYTGKNGEFIQSVIDEFNASQTSYVVTMQYNGNYADQLAKLQVSKQKDLPNLINGSTEQIGTYKTSSFIARLGDIVPSSDPAISGLYGNLRATWGDSSTGMMIGYPMGNSLSGIMVNMHIAREAGIDPYSWKSLDDVYEDCYKIVNGKYAEFAIGTDHSSIYMDYALAIQGVPAVDNDNGSTGTPTKALYNVEPTKSIVRRYFEIWQNLSRDKVCYPLGSSWGNECLPAFASGQIAFLTGTIGGYGRVERAWATAHQEDGKEIDVAFIPWLAVTDEGRSTGLPASGNGFLFIEKGDPVGQQGAWEFVKYFSSPDIQAKWCLQTGYLPIDDAGMRTPGYQDYMTNRFPNVKHVIEAQQKSDAISFYPINPIDSEFKAAGLDALEKVAADPNYDLDLVIEEMTSEINDALDMWNLTNN